MVVPVLTPTQQALTRFAPFGGLDAATLEPLAQSARTCRPTRGEILMHRGARPGGMYLVIEGEIKLFLISSAGAERIVRLAGAGDSFCEENILSDTPQTLAAQATRKSVVIYLPRGALLSAMDAQPALGRALMTNLSVRMGELVDGMEQCIQRSSTQRVAHYLVQHADCSAGDVGADVEVRLSCNKQTIASQLNLTPETFSRVLNRLRRDGFIVPRGRRSITLTDLPSLQLIAA